MNTTYNLPDGSSYTLGNLSDTRKRMLACEILSKLGCDFRVGNPKMDPIDYAAQDLLAACKTAQDELIMLVARVTPSIALNLQAAADKCGRAIKKACK